MSSVIVAGNTSGSVSLTAPDVAGSTVITLPSTSGTMALAGGAGSFTTLSASGESTLTGNVGIGNSSMSSFPAAMRQLVVGSGSGNQGMTIYAGPTSYSAYLAFKSAADTTTQGLIYYDFSNNNLVTYVNGALATNIKSTGQFGVNTTGLSGATGYFEVAGDSASVRNLIATNNTAAGTGSVAFVAFSRNGTYTGGISQTGTTSAFVTSSDYRLKDNVAPMVDALDKVALLKPVTYTWKLDGSAGQGFIAHELQEVVPDAVTGEKDAVNEDGSIKSQGIDTSYLVATLTAAIQEQQALIENLTTRLSALENK